MLMELVFQVGSFDVRKLCYVSAASNDRVCSYSVVVGRAR